MRNAISRSLLLVVLLIALIPVQGQGSVPDAVYIQYAKTAPQGDGLELQTYFTIVDNAGQVVPSVNIRAAEYVIIDSGTYAADVSPATSDYYMTLVLDTSGSMGVSGISAMQAAAIGAVESAPQGTNFSVIRFDNTVRPLIEGFVGRTTALNELSNPLTFGGGTCLYDAAYSAVEQLIQAAPGPDQRRTVLLFTDGRDEMTAGRGDTCSVHTYDELISLASQPGQQVTIHTVGMAGAQSTINRDELGRIANRTGGFAVTGTQGELNARFNEIMVAMSSQWLASALVYPPLGTHDAILRVNLSDGRTLEPDIVQFIADRSYAITPTPAPTVAQPTATPLPPVIEIVGIRTDLINRSVSFELEVENSEQITEYVFRINNEDRGLQQGDVELRSAPVTERITIDARDWPAGRYTIRATAFGAGGTRLAVVDSSQFQYVLPTPTPTETATTTPTPTPSNTPAPCGATYNASQYDGSTLRIFLTVQCAEQIGGLRVELFDGNNQLVGAPYRVPVDEVVTINDPGFVSGQYCVVVTTLDSVGEVLRDAGGRGIISNGCITLATPTPTATATATATPVLVTIAIDAPRQEVDSIVFPLRVSDDSEIESYEVVFISESGISSQPLTYAAPLNELRVPLDQVEGGRYTVEVRALDGQRVPIAEARLPGTLSLPTPTPPAQPAPLSPEWIGSNAGTIVPVIVVFIVALILLLVILLRKPKRKATATAFLDELTGEHNPAPQQYVPPVGEDENDKTNYEVVTDQEATSFEIVLPPPDAMLRVERSSDKSVIGKEVNVTNLPFRIGRKDSNALSIPNDKNVSGEHAVITFTNGMFYIMDNGSSHGTVVNGQPLAKNTPTPLPSGTKIHLAVTTILTFTILSDDDDGGTAIHIED